MYTGCTSIGAKIQTLRRARRMSRAELSEAVGISESHIGKCGNVAIPFDNTIEKGTDLYNLYNTNIHEKIAMEKKKENAGQK